jgi:hypothetical protein
MVGQGFFQDPRHVGAGCNNTSEVFSIPWVNSIGIDGNKISNGISSERPSK